MGLAACPFPQKEPAFQYWGCPTYTGYFQPTTWEPKGLTLWEIDANQLVRTHSRCSPLKESGSLWRPSNFRDAFLGLHIVLPTRRWFKQHHNSCQWQRWSHLPLKVNSFAIHNAIPRQAKYWMGRHQCWRRTSRKERAEAIAEERAAIPVRAKPNLFHSNPNLQNYFPGSTCTHTHTHMCHDEIGLCAQMYKL